MTSRTLHIVFLISAVAYCFSHGVHAQEKTTPKTVEELKSRCNASISTQVGCGVASLYFKTNAQLGDVDYQYKVGQMYRIGYYGNYKRYNRALKWFTKAGRNGHCQSQYWLYRFYKEGVSSISKDVEKSHRWLEKSALNGCKKAANNYTRLLKQPSAFRKNKQLAETGDTPAQFRTAMSYNKALGVSKDNEQSFYWMKQAAISGHPHAQLNLGMMYFNGIGVEKDEQQVLPFIEKAVEQDLPFSKYILGVMYANGETVEKDISLALPLLEAASAAGISEANATLAHLYATGDGVSIDLQKAEALRRYSAIKHAKNHSAVFLIDQW